MGSVLKFFVFTYALSWVCWTAALALSHARPEPPPSFVSILLLVGTFAPAITALLLTLRTEGRSAVHGLLRRLFFWRVALRWYLLAILYLPAIKAAVALTHRLTTGAWPRFGHEALLIIAIATLVSTPAQSGEEIGWRGYALPRLAARYGWARASLLVGAMWGLWHLPLFFLPGADKYGQSVPIYVIGVIALSVAMAWLYARTGGSLLLVMLIHSAFNQTIGIVSDTLLPGEKPFALGASLSFLLTVAYMWIVAAYLIARMRKVELPALVLSPAAHEHAATRSVS